MTESHDTTPRNQRERIGAKGWKQRNRKLIALSQVEEHRSIKYGEERKLV